MSPRQENIDRLLADPPVVTDEALMGIIEGTTTQGDPINGQATIAFICAELLKLRRENDRLRADCSTAMAQQSRAERDTKIAEDTANFCIFTAREAQQEVERLRATNAELRRLGNEMADDLGYGPTTPWREYLAKETR